MHLFEFNRNGQHLDNYPPPLEDAQSYNTVLARYFLKNGWEEIASGNYSYVMKNPNKNFVVKINEKYDKSFAHYCLLIHKFPNKHFPVISNVKLFKNGRGDKFYAYFIEKLEHLPSDAVTDRFIDGINNLTSGIRHNASDNFFKTLRGRYNDAAQFIDANPDAWEAMKIIAKYGKGRIDIHGANIMQREDGTIVFTDPLAFGGTNE